MEDRLDKRWATLSLEEKHTLLGINTSGRLNRGSPNTAQKQLDVFGEPSSGADIKCQQPKPKAQCILKPFDLTLLPKDASVVIVGHQQSASNIMNAFLRAIDPGRAVVFTGSALSTTDNAKTLVPDHYIVDDDLHSFGSIFCGIQDSMRDSKEKQRTAMCFDGVMHAKKALATQEFRHLCANSRHYGSMLVTCNYWTEIPETARRNTDIIVIATLQTSESAHKLFMDFGHQFFETFTQFFQALPTVKSNHIAVFDRLRTGGGIIENSVFYLDLLTVSETTGMIGDSEFLGLRGTLAEGLTKLKKHKE